ncbi:MAG TPA: pilus assembly protein N-terminal domain-containing protein [bacterium]|nr:pilus assembly protein N-terminal domain-containing protein [bacterium]HPR87033.1 pilus assembly protein N-terminal domain-containing protein [bacterium]
MPSLNAASRGEVKVLLGQSEVLSFAAPIKRISIANPDVADATVVTPSQVLINGKLAGATSLVVWDENEVFAIYRVEVGEERLPQQILLKVRFTEINDNALKELGLDFWKKNIDLGGKKADLGLFSGKVNTPSDPLGLADAVDIFFSIPELDFSTIMRALEEKSLLTVLAKPNLCAVNGAEASFLAGGEFPVPIVSGAAGTQSVTIQFKEFGVRLRFLPRIIDSTRINLKIAAEVSSLDFDNGITLSGFNVPALSARKAETTVEMEQGRFLAIGGLLSREMARHVSQIPLLGSIPVLGQLFKSTRFQHKESELLIVVTPEIVGSSLTEPPLDEKLLSR